MCTSILCCFLEAGNRFLNLRTYSDFVSQGTVDIQARFLAHGSDDWRRYFVFTSSEDPTDSVETFYALCEGIICFT